jgi:peptidyl-prolyl cis-trans isomerase SDCCAG10
MSNVYSSEPPTTGKVILVTNYGNIDIELWTKEAPRTCRNFIQLCLENYYNNCIFHRIIKDFMIQTGDHGDGGSSIWGKEFGDEIHSRLRFNHRGIVAMANRNVANSNGSQFFITMDKCTWLDKKHTIFGKIVGDTYFNAHSISDVPTKDDFPIIDMIPKIIRTEVVINPFTDIIPRILKEEVEVNKMENKKIVDIKKLNNTNLLSFDDDFDDKNNIKIKALHEVAKNDKKLVNKPVVVLNPKVNENKEPHSLPEKSKPIARYNKVEEDDNENEEDIEIEEVEQEVKKEKSQSNEIINLKKQIAHIKMRAQKLENEDPQEEEQKLTPLQKLNQQYLNNKRGRVSEIQTIEKLNKFKEKLKSKNEQSWMNNKLKFHVDSQKAYTINDIKEKQMKSFNTL